MGVPKGFKAAGNAFIDSNPVTKAVSGVLSSLGLGGPSRLREKSLRKLRKAIDAGDVAYVMKKAAGSKYVRVRGIAQAALAGAPTFAQAKQVYQVTNAARKAGAWPSSNTPVPGAVPSSAGGSQPAGTTGRSPSAPAAPRPKPPCMYGPRDPTTGYCPKRPSRAATAGSTTLAGLPTTRPKPPCKYGPRGADGYCPKKPRATATATYTNRMIERTATAAGTAARNAAATVIKTVGPGAVLRVVAKASLVGLAGLAAYYMTSKLQKLRYKTWDELKYEAANAYRQARQEVAATQGRGLTPAENAQLAQYFKARMGLIDAAIATGAPRPSGMVNLTFED